MKPNDSGEVMSFWDHLDVLRGSLMRMLAVTVAMGVVAFCLKDVLFAVVMAPGRSDFFIYQWLGGGDFSIRFVNTGLTEQMMVHLKVAFMAGLLTASPYVLYLLFRFISPALYERERRYSVRLTLAAYVMFIVGMAVNYFIIFPLTVRFLGTYQVSADVENMLTISSYVDTMLSMTFLFGLMFEIPVLAWLLGRFGLLRASWMRRYRRHAIVAILVVAAIITPTSDVFTLLIVALPIWLLFEASVFLVE